MHQPQRDQDELRQEHDVQRDADRIVKEETEPDHHDQSNDCIQQAQNRRAD